MVEGLDYSDNADSVNARVATVGEYGDQDVFLEIEWPWIEGEGPVRHRHCEFLRRKDFGHEPAERKSEDLRRDGGDGEAVLAVGEELVGESQHHA